MELWALRNLCYTSRCGWGLAVTYIEECGWTKVHHGPVRFWKLIRKVFRQWASRALGIPPHLLLCCTFSVDYWKGPSWVQHFLSGCEILQNDNQHYYMPWGLQALIHQISINSPFSGFFSILHKGTYYPIPFLGGQSSVFCL